MNARRRGSLSGATAAALLALATFQSHGAHALDRLHVDERSAAQIEQSENEVRPRNGASLSRPSDAALRAVLDAPVPGNMAPLALPTSGEKTGVSSSAIATPQGSGTIQGMGESFSTLRP